MSYPNQGGAPPPNHFRRPYDALQTRPEVYINPNAIAPHHLQAPSSGFAQAQWNQNQTAYYQNTMTTDAKTTAILPQPPPTQHTHYPPNGHIQQQPAARNTYNSPSRSTVIPAKVQRQPSIPEVDHAKLLISLAEEYFEAAHKLAPSLALSMTAEGVGEYQKLIATGLGCLETLLKQAALLNIKISPRDEANVRLRYAGVLFEESNNHMQAETMLCKGIGLCKMNRYYDLKYAMELLLVQVMYSTQPKAALKSLDVHILDAEAYKHSAWVYVFRLLRANYSLQSGNPSDHYAAIQNYKAVSALAAQEEDHEIYIAASVMEAIAHFKSPGADALEQVQAAIGAARKYQLEDENVVPQLHGLIRILDVACSLRQCDNPTIITKKTISMQKYMDSVLQNNAWDLTDDFLEIPIIPAESNSYLASSDTRMILGLGVDGRADSLKLTFLSKKDAYALVYLMGGIVTSQVNNEKNAIKFLNTGLQQLEARLQKRSDVPGVLSDLNAKVRWRSQMLCYYHLYLAFHHATCTDWMTVKTHIDKLQSTIKRFGVDVSGSLGKLVSYLEGVYHQGSGDLEAALRVYRTTTLDVWTIASPITTFEEQLGHDICLLAFLNQFLVLQDDKYFDADENQALILRMQETFQTHRSMDMKMAWNSARACIKTNPPTEILSQKSHLGTAANIAKFRANAQIMAIHFCMTHSLFHEGVVGAQAGVSASTAQMAAKRAQNKLWMAVAEGRMAHYQAATQSPEAQATLQEAERLAHAALPNV